jgi:hypothetical protein
VKPDAEPTMDDLKRKIVELRNEITKLESALSEERYQSGQHRQDAYNQKHIADRYLKIIEAMVIPNK